MNSEKVPSALSSYLRLPPETSLALVTSTLNTTANWVILRYLYAALGNHGQRAAFGAGTDNAEEKSTGVLLVSWMRDLAYWKTEARRALGIDLGRLQQQGRFAFVDGLTSLFTPPVSTPQTPSTTAARTSVPARTPLPARNPAPTRPPPTQQPPAQPNTTTTSSTTQAHTHTLTTPTLAAILSTITAALSAVDTSRILLILDTPSLLLSTTTPAITSSQLASFLLTLRVLPRVHATVLALPADAPFLAPAGKAALAQLHGLRPGGDGGRDVEDPLARENAAFMVSCVQMARWVVGCRMLGTGWAEDVSGVVRVTRGGCAGEVVEGGEDSEGGEAESEEVKEGEWLYYVGGHGGVKVWGRGESGR